MDNVELLAPAGSKAALIAAVQSGANAVYMGGPHFSARQTADNFDMSEMKKWVDYCHLRGVKVHVAVNTLIKENEISALTEYAYELNQIGIDAVIIQDIGAIKIFRKIVPQLPLHASTQMTVHSLEGVKYLENMGFERVVLSRELSMKNIEYICRNANCEIEVFAHGALCISYSGQCLMSSIIGGRSGNRGLCAQPCRLSYELMESGKAMKKGHLLSTKDLALVDELKTLKKIGVKSLKIEGRLKRAEYVAAVVGVYRKYLDSENSVTDKDKKELMDAFNRSGFTKAYFGGQTGGKMMSFETPGNVGENIFSDDVKKRCKDDANLRLIKVRIEAVLKKEDLLKVTMTDIDGNTAYAIGTIKAESAQNRAIDKERLKEQLSKLGSSAFFADEVNIELDDGVSIPISEINSVRRKAVEILELQRTSVKKRCSYPIQKKENTKKFCESIELTAEINTIEQAKAVIKNGIRKIYAPSKLADKIIELSGNIEVITKLPNIMQDNMQNESVNTDSVLIHFPWQSVACQNKKIYGNFRLNVFNSFSADFYSDLECLTLSPELNLREIKDLTAHTSTPTELIVYGRIPLMVTQNCPVKASGKCHNDGKTFSLKDRKQEVFPIMCGEGCAAEILNSKPIFMADKMQDIKKLKIKSLRLIFTVENLGECDRIVNMYRCALSENGENFNMPENSFTRGHYYRGVQ